MTVKYDVYRKDKDSFFKKHDHDFQCDTSPMDSYGVYYKTYVFADGAIWYERMAPVWRTAKASVEVEGIMVDIEKDIKLFETEYFNSDNATSKKYYEKW